jgi:hypothetical protein
MLMEATNMISTYSTQHVALLLFSDVEGWISSVGATAEF